MTVVEHWACPRHPDTFARVKWNGGALWCHECKRDIPDAIKVVVVLAEQHAGAVEELRALLHAADEEARSQFEPPDRLREAILRADAWLTANGGPA
jgi:hypothetical protein